MALWQDLPTDRFDLAYIDWPWKWKARSAKGDGRAPRYPRLALADLKTFPLRDLLKPNAAVLMWVPDSHTPQLFELAGHFGLFYSTKAFCWVKQNENGSFPIGLGKTTRPNPEDCFLFWRGEGLPIRDHSIPRLVLAPRREHSRKPDEVRDRIVRLFGSRAKRIELFARDRDPRFTAWGNQLPPACDHHAWLFARDGRRCPECGATIVDPGD